MKKLFFLLLIALLAGACESPQAPAEMDGQANLPLDQIKLPKGFRISVYASDVDDARSMALSPNGTLFVGNRSKDKVYALVDENGDKKADRKYVVATGLKMPCGVAFKDGDLYVAEVNRILKFEGIEAKLANPPAPKVVYDQYPTETHHGWKFIAFGPDGHLYVPVGAPCNVCKEENPVYASVTRLNTTTGKMEVFAHGVRNSVGFDWHPATRELWFTSNGRDRLGDDLPPDVLNHAPRAGMHFGFPFCHGGDLPDPEFGSQRPCADFVPPAQKLGPHVAALGMRFYTGQMFPNEYRNQIIIAEHGSWNRSSKIGYRLTLVKLSGNKAVSYTPFAEGWLQGEKAWGRPVDVLVMPDGSLLVSDDYADAIYRITYEG